MTVLRSREIVSAVKSQTPPSTLIDPPTPVKSAEPSNHRSGSSPNFCSDSVASSVTVRRRSVRLSSRTDSCNLVEDDACVSNRKRKSMNNLGKPNVMKENMDVAEDECLDLGVRNVRVSDSGNVKEKEIDDMKLLPDDSDKSVLIPELGISNGGSDKVIKGTQSKGKRKAEGDRLSGDDEASKRYLSLRSGAKLEERKMEGISSDSVVIGTECGDGGDEGKERDGELNGLKEQNVVKNELDGDQRVDGNGTVGGIRRSARGEKGKGKVVIEEALKPEEDLDKKVSNDGNGTSVQTRRRHCRAEKGKEKMDEDVLLSNNSDTIELNSKSELDIPIDKDVPNSISIAENVVSQGEAEVREVNLNVANHWRGDYRERFREFARRNASRFAHFSNQEEDENIIDDLPPREAEKEVEDWPGPFSTAMKIIKDRERNVNAQQSSSLNNSKPASFIWVPRKDHCHVHHKAPSLEELSMGVLVKNADAITSIDGVPDFMRHKLSQLLCDSRKMEGPFLDLLFSGSPTEIRVRDCSWLSEEQLTKSFERCKTNNLMVLQLDQCGRCMPDYILLTTLARSANNLPALTTISLKGACRLSDVGLRALVSATPALRSINLSQCSLLTFEGIGTLADSLGSVLRELYLDDCETIDPMLILPALKKFEHLEVLSLAGIQTVSDAFIRNFILARGLNLRELVLSDCVKLTDSSMKVIAETCSCLHALDLVNLQKLTDFAIGYLANGCRELQTLKLSRNSFSDEAVAAFLETSGESLTELSLNNVTKVNQNTAMSLAKHSRKLVSLDLSWCRNMTDEALGLIVDSCLSLKVLKLFGCSQITKVFLDGHSNPQVQIIGLKMTPILKHLKVPDPLQGVPLPC